MNKKDYKFFLYLALFLILSSAISKGCSKPSRYKYDEVKGIFVEKER
jgi:hypothetical protein